MNAFAVVLDCDNRSNGARLDVSPSKCGLNAVGADTHSIADLKPRDNDEVGLVVPNTNRRVNQRLQRRVYEAREFRGEVRDCVK